MLTHEASIGRLAEDEINNLQAKGFTNDEAVSLFVRGFITTDILSYLPEQARRYIEQYRETSGGEGPVTSASIHSGDVGVMFYICGEVAT